MANNILTESEISFLEEDERKKYMFTMKKVK